MTKHPCFVCGQNMTVAAHRRILFLEDDNHRTVEVGKDCYARAVAAAGEGIARIGAPQTVRVFQRLEQAQAYRREKDAAPRT